jgi:beta-galactosidase
MRSLHTLLLSVVLLLTGASAAHAADGRMRFDLSASWKFLPADEPKAAKKGFDDASWQSVDLPHTWNGLDGQDGGGNYRRGPGWYRRHLTAGTDLTGKRVYLQFDGASLMADVYVNGIHLGNHQGGFALFRFDVTDALHLGGDNVIAVRVDNSNLGIPPNEADFTICGGLYRRVWLLATNPVQISTMDMGSPGVFVEQRSVTAAAASLMVRAELENHGAEPRDVDVRMAVRDATGHAVADTSFRVHLDATGATEVEKPLTVLRPHLWNARADPYLYSVRVALTPVASDGSKGSLSDAVVQPLGLRYYSVDPKLGFLLNGKYLDLHGFNRHQDRPDKGWAISDADEAEDFAFVMESGATAMRMSHYQQSDSWYTRCDRSGIVGWAEIPSWGLGLATPEYLESGEQQLRELVRQNYNHPSICFWGVGNETRGTAADSVAAALSVVAHEEDPTRLSTYASNHDASDPRNWHSDVFSFNRYYGWYSASVRDFTDWLVKTRADYPNARYGMSEFGAGASIYQHAVNPPPPAPRGPFHPEEYQNTYHEAYWADLKTRPYIWCKFIWCLFDFASDGRNEGDHAGRNDKGLVTYDRKVRKDAFYFYKANWSEDPVLHITSARYTDRTEAVTEVKVYSNARKVSLEVNGLRMGAQAEHGEDRIFRWSGVRLLPGANHIVVTAHIGGDVVTDSCVWTLKPR